MKSIFRTIRKCIWNIQNNRKERREEKEYFAQQARIVAGVERLSYEEVIPIFKQLNVAYTINGSKASLEELIPTFEQFNVSYRFEYDESRQFNKNVIIVDKEERL